MKITRQQARIQDQELALGLLERWNRREVVRDARLAAVQKLGPLGAAPPLEAAERLAHATQAEGKTYEAVFGAYDIEPVNYLPRGMRAARAVCRIVDRGVALGTGFLVAPGLVLTNHHVIGFPEDAEGVVAEFNFEYDADERPLELLRIPLAPGNLFISSRDVVLDFTFIALDAAAFQRFADVLAWLPMDKRRNKIVEGEPAVAIQHPQGEDKKLCLFDSVLVDRLTDPDSPYIHYTTDTARGASGSPVFNRHWQLIGLHHAATTVQGEGGKPIGVNEGVRVSSIVTALESDATLIMERESMRGQVLTTLQRPQVAGNGRPQSTGRAEGTSPPRPGEAPELEGRISRTRIRTLQLSHYEGRKGFDEGFLGRGAALKVPLPRLSAALKDDAAPLLADPSEYRLDYAHYSLVMCASRALAYYSAVNMHGPSMPATFDRENRLDIGDLIADKEYERAADQWYYDPRIAREHQLGPEVYDDPVTRFAFGHITRRADAVWSEDGSEDEMWLANDDTFHLTNCAPQVSSFNSGGHWGSLENAVAKFARSNGGMRLCVFSGPVLSSRDPRILGVKIPTAYWKVVAFASKGKLNALGFMTYQSDEVKEQRELARKAYESLKELIEKSGTEQWLLPIRDIARETSLDFGPLLDADLVVRGGKKKLQMDEARLSELFESLA